MDNRKIARAWEKFVENGTSPNVVREVVAASWKRSQGYQIPVERSETRLATNAELVQRRVERSELIEAAYPALEQLGFLLAESRSMVILTDSSGVIIETLGDPRTIDYGRIIHLEEGGLWSEADIGTNAIGTALVALQPIQLQGVEHFCSEVQRWTCAAAPIRHPISGQLLGILDVSGLAKTFNPQSLAFTYAITKQIEQALALSIKEEHEQILRYALNRRSHWLTEDLIAIDRRGNVVYGARRALQVVERRNRGLIRGGHLSSLDRVAVMAWPARLNRLVPNASTELVVDSNRVIGAILVLHRPQRKCVPTITAEQMRTALAREREISARQRTIELAKANQALQECLDALASVPELDELLGQVMIAITRQLGAASSVLRLRDFEHNCLTIDRLFENGREIALAEAAYPQTLQVIPLDEQHLRFLAQPAAVLQLLDDFSTLPDQVRACLLGLGVKTSLVVPLNIATQLVGTLNFHFLERREFRLEEIEIARALESQVVLAIQVTRLATAAKQAAILQERTRLAAEIHDGLAQSFTAICLQLGVAKQELSSQTGDPLDRIQRAVELAQFGLDEARRCAHNLRLSMVEESGLKVELQRLAERSSVAGRLSCDFRSNRIPEDKLPPRLSHELLRIAQEAVHNAARHA
ncbi:MAG: GAF domain-containing protein, partial [Verrucomicrobia bacterium]|nr:GAF domain-containing protein [Verrucomicrobiota bacterium]